MEILIILLVMFLMLMGMGDEWYTSQISKYEIIGGLDLTNKYQKYYNNTVEKKQLTKEK